MEELQEGAPVAGFKTTPLSRSQALLRELEVGEDLDCLAGPGELCFESLG
ncbi:MAG: hypothetical protein ABI333_08400 [bacterium]